MQLQGVVADTVTTERSAEEVRCEILKTRDATILTLAVFLAVAIAAASSNPVFAQYAPCPPGYSYVGAGCYPSYNNPYGNCQTGYYNPSYGCYYQGNYSPYNNPYNQYSNCQNGYYQNGYPGSNCYHPSNNNYYSNNYYSNNYYPGNYYRGYNYGNNYYRGYNYRNSCNHYGNNCHR
jgi:hypothetical protein